MIQQIYRLNRRILKPSNSENCRQLHTETQARTGHKTATKYYIPTETPDQLHTHRANFNRLETAATFATSQADHRTRPQHPNFPRKSVRAAAAERATKPPRMGGRARFPGWCVRRGFPAFSRAGRLYRGIVGTRARRTRPSRVLERPRVTPGASTRTRTLPFIYLIFLHGHSLW